MDGWTIGADIGIMLTGVAILPTAGVWLLKQWREWRATNRRRSTLRPGESLLVGDSLYSPDGRTRFTLQRDANMVVSVEGYGVFDDTGTGGQGIPKCLKLEVDGWLVLYAMDGQRIWKCGPEGARLQVQDNAHVVLYRASNQAICATDWLLMRGEPQHHAGLDIGVQSFRDA